MDYKVYAAQDFPAYLPKLNQLYDDLFSGGKGFRGKMIELMGSSLQVPFQTQKLLAQTIEFIHNASLLHDDLVDRSHLRRGKTTAWLKYTPEYAVLAGDYLLARVMVNLSSHGNIHLVHYTSQIISDLLEGEWIQDSLVGDFNVTLEQLDRVHNLKTASLFKWCLRSPFIALDRRDEKMHHMLEEMGTILGQLFQRSDDLLDFDIRNLEGKAILGDLKSGYLNSFGSFMAKDLTPQEKQKFIKSESLVELKNNMGGEKKFDETLKGFDEANQKQIELYNHLLTQLKAYLQPEEYNLLDKLKPLTEILYWRRKPS